MNDLIHLHRTLQSRCDHLCISQMSLRHAHAQHPSEAALMEADCVVQSGTLCPAALMEAKRVWAGELVLLKHVQGKVQEDFFGKEHFFRLQKKKI